MKIIINSSSMIPIYEQIMDQIKAQIKAGDLKENDILPSVRTLAKELKISALTVKSHMIISNRKVYSYSPRKRHLCSGCKYGTPSGGTEKRIGERSGKSGGERTQMRTEG